VALCGRAGGDRVRALRGDRHLDVLGGEPPRPPNHPPASFVAQPLQFVVAALLAAWGFLDYPFSQRGVGVGARVRWIGLRFGAVLGFGLAAATMLLIPCVGFLVLPLGVAGAARLVAEGER
jgi:uncharacterized protein involved in cysteine biosynthesis